MATEKKTASLDLRFLAVFNGAELLREERSKLAPPQQQDAALVADKAYAAAITRVSIAQMEQGGNSYLASPRPDPIGATASSTTPTTAVAPTTHHKTVFDPLAPAADSASLPQPPPAAVPASLLAPRGGRIETSAAAMQHHDYGKNFVYITKEKEQNALSFAKENGKYEIAATCFATLVHRTLLARGKWMYETTLLSDGVFQIGFAPPHDRVGWVPNLGVGDYVNSVAFDGFRQRLWKVTARDDGRLPRWLEADVVTSCIDLDEGVASFYLNGVFVTSTSMADLARTAEDDDESLPHYLYCPAISFGQREMATLNFGEAPFAFPQPGFAGVAWASQDPLQGPPDFLRAHVVAELTISIDEEPSWSTRQKNQAMARLCSKLDSAAARQLGTNAANLLLRPFSLRELPPTSSTPLNVNAAPLQDGVAKRRIDAIIGHWSRFISCAPFVFADLCSELSAANRAITFDVPSRVQQNYRSRAALRIAAHAIPTHFTTLCAQWPADGGIPLDRHLIPFCKQRALTVEMQAEIMGDDQIDLADPLAPSVPQDIARRVASDLFDRIQPHREAVMHPFCEWRPLLVTNFIMTSVERQQDAAATRGHMVFTLLASVVAKHAVKLDDEALCRTYASRDSLASERALQVDPRRLGGTVIPIINRSKLNVYRAPAKDQSVNPLLITLTWLFHATSRRQSSTLMSVLTDLDQQVTQLKNLPDDAPAEQREEIVAMIKKLTRILVIQRGRVAHPTTVELLFNLATALARIIEVYTTYAAGAVGSPNENALSRGLKLRELTRPGERTINLALLPIGFISTLTVVLHIGRRTTPTKLSTFLASHRELLRLVPAVALNPLIENNEAAETTIQFATLALEPPLADPQPHFAALQATLSNEQVALLIARCFGQLQHDMSWSIGINLLSSISFGHALLRPRPGPGSVFASWLLFDGEDDQAKTDVPGHGISNCAALMRGAIRLLDNATIVRDRQRDSGSMADVDRLEAEMNVSKDLGKGLRTLTSRCSWLVSEFEVAAQDEDMGRGTAQSRQRMAIIFDLLQNGLSTIEFILAAAGDLLVTEDDIAPNASVPVPVQMCVELVMLLFRDYGRPGSLMLRIPTMADRKEFSAMKPWRMLGPLVGILMLWATPQLPEGKSVLFQSAGSNASHRATEFQPWQRVFHRMLESRRCQWEMPHITAAVELLSIPTLLRERLVTAPNDLVLKTLASDEWLQVLQARLDARRAQDAAASPSKAGQRSKQRSSGMSSRVATATDSSAGAARPPSAAGSTATMDSPSAGQQPNSMVACRESTSILFDDQDETMCPICCCDPIDVEFQPCGHRSCRLCIERQLQGAQKRCFFCNAEVDKVVDCVAPESPVSARLPPQSAGSFPAQMSEVLKAVGPDAPPSPDESSRRGSR